MCTASRERWERLASSGRWADWRGKAVGQKVLGGVLGLVDTPAVRRRWPGAPRAVFLPALQLENRGPASLHPVPDYPLPTSARRLALARPSEKALLTWPWGVVGVGRPCAASRGRSASRGYTTAELGAPPVPACHPLHSAGRAHLPGGEGPVQGCQRQIDQAGAPVGGLLSPAHRQGRGGSGQVAARS